MGLMGIERFDNIFIFYRYMSQWNKKGNNIDGETAGDDSGRSVSLSADW